MSSEEKPKYSQVAEGVAMLSLGISMVVAVVIGVGIGIGLEKLFGYRWLFWLGVFWGVSASFLNVYKAYKKQKRELDKLKDDPKYQYGKYKYDEEED